MWKEIPGYEGRYEISDDGFVKSVSRKIKSKTGQEYMLSGRILKPNTISNGYNIVHLCSEGKRTAYYVHKLVAEAYVPNPNNYPVVNHKNGNKSQCQAENLEWTTYAQNNQHAYDNGLRGKGELQYKAKLTEKDVIEIRESGKYTTYEKIAQKYGVTKATIRDVLVNRTWKNVK